MALLMTDEIESLKKRKSEDAKRVNMKLAK